MKLYTEEEVFKAIQMADKYHYLITSIECDIINSLTPIELPSHYEIWEEAIKEELNQRRYDFMRGADFVRNKIQGP